MNARQAQINALIAERKISVLFQDLVSVTWDFLGGYDFSEEFRQALSAAVWSFYRQIDSAQEAVLDMDIGDGHIYIKANRLSEGKIEIWWEIETQNEEVQRLWNEKEFSSDKTEFALAPRPENFGKMPKDPNEAAWMKFNIGGAVVIVSIIALVVCSIGFLFTQSMGCFGYPMLIAIGGLIIGLFLVSNPPSHL